MVFAASSSDDGAAEDLADRVEKIDLLVSFGELVGRVLDLERVLEILRHDGKQELEIAVDLAALDRARAEREPRATRPGDRHGDETSALGGSSRIDAESAGAARAAAGRRAACRR